jgi:hypothetical protein
MSRSRCASFAALAASFLAAVFATPAGAAMSPATGFTMQQGSMPVAAASPEGSAAVAFVDGGVLKVALKPSASGFLPLQSLGASSSLPAIAAAEDGTIAVAWPRTNGTDVAVRAPGSDVFGAVRSVASTGLVNVAIAPSGRLYLGTASAVFSAATATDPLVKVLTLQRSTQLYPPSLAIDTNDGAVVVASGTAAPEANTDVAIQRWSPASGAAAPIVVPGERPTDGRGAMAWQFAGMSGPEPALFWTRYQFCSSVASPCGSVSGEAILTRWMGGVKKDLATVSGAVFLGAWPGQPVVAVNPADGSGFVARGISGPRSGVSGSTAIQGYQFSPVHGWWDLAAPYPLNDAIGANEYGAVAVAPYAGSVSFSIYTSTGTSLLRHDTSRFNGPVDTVATETNGFRTVNAAGTGFGDGLVAYSTGAPEVVHILSEDFAAPNLTVDVPATGVAGVQRLVARVTDWSATSITWKFEDGATATGSEIERNLPEGRSTITVTATDAAGHIASRVVTVTRTAPVVQSQPQPTGVASPESRWPAGRLEVTAPGQVQARGSGVRAAGRVVSNAGVPIAGAPIVVRGRPRVAGAAWALLPAVTADGDGRFSVPIPSGSSYDVRLEYVHAGGTAAQELSVAVRGTLSLTPAKQRVPRFGRLRLSGELGVDHLTKRGAYIDLQLRQGGSWRTVATVRTSARGRWSWRYRLASGQRASYRFRAKLRPAVDVPSAPTTSRTVRVDVR